MRVTRVQLLAASLGALTLAACPSAQQGTGGGNSSSVGGSVGGVSTGGLAGSGAGSTGGLAVGSASSAGAAIGSSGGASGGSTSTGGTSGGAPCSPACPTADYCLNGTCTTRQVGGACTISAACLGYCNAGSCTPCATDANCGAGAYCLETACLPQGGAGATCVANDWCLSNVCTDDVCVGGGGSTGGSAGSADGGFDEATLLTTMGDPGPLFDGGTTTFGGLSLTVTFDGGTRYVTSTLTIAPGEAPIVLQQLIYWNGDNSYVTGTGSMNTTMLGQVDWEYTSFYDAGAQTYTSTTLEDLNDDGTFDNQDVWVVNVSQWPPYQKSEVVSKLLYPDGGLAGDGGSWVQQWSSSGPATADGLGADKHLALLPIFSWLPPSMLAKLTLSCGGQDSFPAPSVIAPLPITSYLVVPGTQIHILTDSTVSGFCNGMQAQELEVGFANALEMSAACYPGIYPTNGLDVKLAAQGQELIVACANSCSDDLVSTDLPFSPHTVSVSNAIVGGNGYQRMNVNPSLALGQGHGPYWLEEILIHELLHYAGHDHVGLNGSPPGHDMVYGCGRYCTGCLTTGAVATYAPEWAAPPTPAQWAFDCADCAYPSGLWQLTCGQGLYKVSDEGTCTCPPAGPSTGTCETTIAESCFADQALTGAGRDEYLEGLSVSAVGICSGCNSPPGLCCASEGDGVDLFACTGTSEQPCTAWPVGWCQGSGG